VLVSVAGSSARPQRLPTEPAWRAVEWSDRRRGEDIRHAAGPDASPSGASAAPEPERL